MTNEEMIENLKCVIADLTEQGNELLAENAALSARLANAVELPCIETVKVYGLTYYDVVSRDEFGHIEVNIYPEPLKDKAFERLAKTKGEVK